MAKNKTITEQFMELRSDSLNPQTGRWEKDYNDALLKAKRNGKFIVAFWTNGESCPSCRVTEKCMLTTTFNNWLATQDVYFICHYCGDKNEGAELRDWIYRTTGIRAYPGFRVTLYNKKGKMVVDQAVEGHKLRNNKTGKAGASAMILNLEKIFGQDTTKHDPSPAPGSLFIPITSDLEKIEMGFDWNSNQIILTPVNKTT